MQTIKSEGVLFRRENYGIYLWDHGTDFCAFCFALWFVGSDGRHGKYRAQQSLRRAGRDWRGIIALFIPIVYGVMGFIAGAIGALIYNLMAKWVGGIQIELQSQAVGQYAAGQGA